MCERLRERVKERESEREREKEKERGCALISTLNKCNLFLNQFKNNVLITL